MTIDDTDPLDPSGDSLDLAQVCWTAEAENADGYNASAVSNSEMSGGQGLSLDDDGAGGVGPSTIKFPFTTSHTIPGENLNVAVRRDSGGANDETSGVDVILQQESGSSTTIASLPRGQGLFLSWDTDPVGGSGPWIAENDPPDLPPGDHTLEFRCTDTDGAIGSYESHVDVAAPFDTRFQPSLTFDNDNGGGGGYLDGPELYPDVVPVQLTTTETRRDVTEATAEIDTNTTDANQYIELRIGSDAFDRTNNAASASTTGGPARSIDVTLGLTRYPDDSNPQSATPRYGYNGQSVDSYSLTANPDSITGSGVGEAEVDAIVAQGEITGDRLEEAAQLTSGGTTLTRSILAPFDVFAETSLRSSEKISFNNDE